MNKYHILTVALLLGTSVLMESCGNKDSAKKGPNAGMQATATPVTTALVGQETITGVRSYPSNVVPLQETEIRAEVSGYITNIYVSDGAYVNKGQRLYEIDRVRYAAAVEQAKASLEIAKANLARVEKDLERYQKLADQDAIAKQTLDYAFTDVNNQKAQVQAAQAALTTAKTNLNRSTIVAPFSGNIGISMVRSGALVSAGTTLLNTISSTNPIAVEFQINEKEISEFTNLQSGKSTTKINLTLPDGSTYGSSGRISTMDRAVDPQTGTLKVRATFDNPANTLRAGLNLTLNVQNTTEHQETVIPYRAVFEQLGTFSVYVVNDSSIVDLKQVSLGQKLGEKVVILNGLNTGERIVVDGVASLKQGSKVVEKNDASTEPKK